MVSLNWNGVGGGGGLMLQYYECVGVLSFSILWTKEVAGKSLFTSSLGFQLRSEDVLPWTDEELKTVNQHVKGKLN